MSPLDEAWVREAKRLHERYLTEVVEAYDLCPWAQRARLDARTRVSVVLEADGAAIQSSVGILAPWIDEPMDIGFLIFPHVPLRRLEFDRFVARLLQALGEHHASGVVPFALAAFHPDAAPELDRPDRLVPFLRRTPDPCVQAIRMAALDRVRRGANAGTQFLDVASLDASLSDEPAPVPLRERIARANLDTVLRAGVDALSARFEAIQHDRATTYRALRESETHRRNAPAAG